MSTVLGTPLPALLDEVFVCTTSWATRSPRLASNPVDSSACLPH
ncbi:hypothetical protein [Nocardia asteroides]|nr:hypothetical protein [Nocardia asteroides]